MKRDITRAVAELEGMQDVPFPGMETIPETPAKIFVEVESVVWRVLNSGGQEWKSYSGKTYYARRGTATAQANRINGKVQEGRVTWLSIES